MLRGRWARPVCLLVWMVDESVEKGRLAGWGTASTLPIPSATAPTSAISCMLAVLVSVWRGVARVRSQERSACVLMRFHFSGGRGHHDFLYRIIVNLAKS